MENSIEAPQNIEKIELLYDLIIPHRGIYPKDMTTVY